MTIEIIIENIALYQLKRRKKDMENDMVNLKAKLFDQSEQPEINENSEEPLNEGD
jgi:hypothetical protein